MKKYLISDNVDTWTGMRLAGVEGCVVHGKDELQKELDKVMADKEVGIVLLTEGFGRRFPGTGKQSKAEPDPSVCGDSRPTWNRPQARLYHLLCQ